MERKRIEAVYGQTRREGRTMNNRVRAGRSAVRSVAALSAVALLSGALWACASRTATVRHAGNEVTFRTNDGWTIAGDLYKPAGAPKGAVILLHQRGGSAGDWTPLCEALRAAGIQALAIDQRGSGRSTTGPGPLGQNAPWVTAGDITAAIAYLKPRGPIGLCGASYGANNALIYAASHGKRIAAVALFSPGADYHGLLALPAAKAYHGDVFIVHGSGDAIAGEGPAQISRAAAGRHTFRQLDSPSHGTGLLDPTIDRETVSWFLQAFHTR
jgi:pimeloyl-ACP methyl ester carboxylesterase